MGRFSWHAEEALNITEILPGLGRKVADRLSDRRIVPAGEGIVHHVRPLARLIAMHRLS
jgi:hypothetical protein